MISANIKKLRKRIERLQKYPGLHKNMIQGFACKDAIDMIKTFQKKLRDGNYSVEPLHPFSIAMKEDKGYEKPKSPLYGAGKSEEASLYNSLRIRLLQNGARVYVSGKKHHEAGMALKDLFKIHEYGCYIPVTDAMRAYLHAKGLHLRNETSFIIIPPRPVFRTALSEQKKVIKKGRSERNKYIKKAMQEYISQGRSIKINRMAKYIKEVGKYAEGA